MAMVKTASIELTGSGGVSTVDVTFEQSLFADSLKVRKQVDGLGSQNLAVHVNTIDNTQVVEAAKPLLADHDDDTDVPTGYIQCTCSVKPTADMRFRVFVLEQ